MDDNWTPSSWTLKPVKQEVVYEDKERFQAALQKLQRLPPLVTPYEVANLKDSLKNAALGRAFVLQGGDCAELFDYCNQDMIESKIKLILQMSLILIWGSNKPVIRIARIAGQFAKPRSSPCETINGVTMPSFRGDNVNGFDPTPESRKPDPSRLVSAYFHSAATLNYVRSALSSGFADLHSPLDWGLGHITTPAIKEKYERIVSRLTDSLRFMQTVGLDTDRGIETVDFYASHEGLMLEYEQSLTRLLKHPAIALPGSDNTTARRASMHSRPSPTGYYATSAHFLWIGDRTRQLDGAHVEFFRGISNPIGIKIGPTMQPDELISLLDIVNPSREIGKVTLISRYGASKIAEYLPAHIKAVQASGHVPVWQCDPMHGNTRATPSGVKTRHFTDILSELKQALEIHRSLGSYLGGMHLELTGEAVTECVGGAAGLTEDGLSERYETFCDPRLNEKQALELAFLVAGFYREELDEPVANTI
ncbi:3-deoxy-7-phosphoheptulonate synthase [Coccidioides immitis RS]|uniref:Phospho-2-dehydro-3-deoxyheptonate aldolase n=3 Tax=Coccidioides immitis TaxID=5501 RepID=A0A0E1RVA5_COCIM|nr:3-deoxy-7-phosphoheptulonate synthase [Coccidioides immitis RS]EAS29556.1 3-deoxy-7-phosphoheptulonate synthase [Coccidioides immitis RS]KMP06632.1 phospho-2-dehydro-3-deoxyheptonate aldolase [Coccidioides immitis RMSCC 2394]KMU73681.1 phospho-2-dehydro-3-deoxyheptonate aldolase [Coccidioides immitis RMSCC 3703]